MSGDLKTLFVTLMEEVFNRGNLNVAEGLVAQNFYNHEAPDSPGPDGFKSSQTATLSSAPPDQAVPDRTVE